MSSVAQQRPAHRREDTLDAVPRQEGNTSDRIEDGGRVDVDVESHSSNSHSNKKDMLSEEEEAGGRRSISTESDRPASDVVEQQQRGVRSIESLYRVFGKNSAAIWCLYLALAAVVCAFTFDNSTTSSYQVYGASAFGKHGSLMGSIDTAEGIIIAVSKPFLAKIADISSRQTAYSVVLACYVIGYIVIAASPTAASFAVGRVISATGQAGFDLVTDIIIADISPLEWRAFMTALTSLPYIIFGFVGGLVSGPLVDRGQWRWGFGMFTIITPVCVLPAILVLYWAEARAKKVGILSFGASPYERRLAAERQKTQQQDGDAPLPAPVEDKPSYWSLVRSFCIEIDLIGLLLLGFAFSLIFIPFSLASGAKGGWSNPSMIAMIVVGFVCLILTAVWEMYFSPKPFITRRILQNKVFLLAVGIDIFYFASGNMRSTYYSSYVYVIKAWSARDWQFFINTSLVGLSFFGVIIGIILRATHRYKMLQIVGICIRMVGMGLTLWARGEHASDVALVWTQILIALGGACSVVGTRVATQASVPHQDLATIIAQLALWTKLGGSVGSAIAGAVWTNTVPGYMREEGVPEKLIPTLYGKLVSVHTKYDLNDPIRQAVIRAADRALYPLFLAALILSCVPVILALYMPNYFLGRSQNKVDGTDVTGKRIEASQATHGTEMAAVVDPRISPEELERRRLELEQAPWWKKMLSHFT